MLPMNIAREREVGTGANERENCVFQWKGESRYLAITKSSRTIRAPSPMYFCTSSEPETRMNVQSV